MLAIASAFVLSPGALAVEAAATWAAVTATAMSEASLPLKKGMSVEPSSPTPPGWVTPLASVPPAWTALVCVISVLAIVLSVVW